MSNSTGIATGDRKFSLRLGNLRSLVLKYPEWRSWALSIFAWVLLIITQFTAAPEVRVPGRIIYCMPSAVVEGVLKQQDILSVIGAVLSNGIGRWILMIVAMMFPLLNEPVKHVGSSVRRKDRGIAIAGFLAGYTMIWITAGAFFLLLPVLIDRVMGEQPPFINGLVKASAFLLAAAFTWHPSRPVRMAKCSITVPISISGRQLHADTITFGWKMGLACLNMCWLPMAALMLAHHNVVLMYIATIVLIYERYLLPHKSKLPGYAWALIALALLGIEMWG